MKLRLRNLESKETIRIEVVSPCSVHQLQQTLSRFLFPPPSSPSSLRFSLNAKDELCDPSPHSSLQSLGVTGGDLIYFSLNPNAFSAQFPVQEPQTLIPVQELNSIEELRAIEGSPIGGKPEMSLETKELEMNFPNFETPDCQISLGSDAQMFTEALGRKEAEKTADEEAEIMDADGTSVRDFSEPYFLSKILREELGEDRINQKLLVISVHAVFLESGFVGFDPFSGLEDRRQLLDKCLSFCHTPSIFYTLPELLWNDNRRNVTEKYVVLKIQTLGNFVSVYGSLAGNGSRLHKVHLGERFAVAIEYFLSKDGNVGMYDKDGSLKIDRNSSVFDFWKVVKDELALPLMADLCDETGLALPACLVRLPTELKLRILESLSGVDLARMECVSKEMKYLVSNNSLWKQRFAEEFGFRIRVEEPVKWKQLFASQWETRKKEKFALTRWQGYSQVARPSFMRVRRDPNPFAFPGMVGGDHDRLPGLLAPPPFAPPHPAFPYVRPRRSFRTNCNLGGHNV